MAPDLRRNTERARFELLVDGQVVGILDYHAEGDTLVLPHTAIDASERGRGLGATLVQYALDEIRHDGQRIVPTCSFVAQFLDEHPQYQDLIAA